MSAVSIAKDASAPVESRPSYSGGGTASSYRERPRRGAHSSSRVAVAPGGVQYTTDPLFHVFGFVWRRAAESQPCPQQRSSPQGGRQLSPLE